MRSLNLKVWYVYVGSLPQAPGDVFVAALIYCDMYSMLIMLILLPVHPKISTWYPNETGSEHVPRFEESKDHNNREEKLSWDMKREVVPLIRREKH